MSTGTVECANASMFKCETIPWHRIGQVVSHTRGRADHSDNGAERAIRPAATRPVGR
jgi:hypothetical protein